MWEKFHFQLHFHLHFSMLLIFFNVICQSVSRSHPFRTNPGFCPAHEIISRPSVHLKDSTVFWVHKQGIQQMYYGPFKLHCLTNWEWKQAPRDLRRECLKYLLEGSFGSVWWGWYCCFVYTHLWLVVKVCWDFAFSSVLGSLGSFQPKSPKC